METNVVMVKLWKMPVGYLSWDKKSETAFFEYEAEFLDRGLDITPLTMSVYSPRNRTHIPWTGYTALYINLRTMLRN